MVRDPAGTVQLSEGVVVHRLAVLVEDVVLAVDMLGLGGVHPLGSDDLPVFCLKDGWCVIDNEYSGVLQAL